MAAERPFVASLPEGDAADLVRLAGSGIVVPPDLPHKLVTAILRLYENPETRQLLGRSGRQYVEENLTAEDAAQSIQSIFTSAKKINEVISL
jgi:glycosyltransferase involved in cell wall biosynthesis